MGLKSRTSTRDPFLLFGHGVGTSARCLECYLWFARPPTQRDRAWIVRQLPFPVASFARFDGALLHFGSDDDLEARVLAAYHPDYGGRAPSRVLDETSMDSEPSPREWKAFCADFDQVVATIHQRTPLVAAVKPDDGAYGRKLSPWHRRSLARAGELAESAAAQSSSSRDAWSALAQNLREEIAAEPEKAAPARPPTSAPAQQPKLSPAQQRARTDGKNMIRAALSAVVIPSLRDMGFEGSFPAFRRLARKRTHVLWFELESGEYADVGVGFAVMATHKGATLRQDANRAFMPRSKRDHLRRIAPDDQRPLLWYEDAAAKWGDAWPQRLAELVRHLITTRVERWLAARS